MENMNFVEENYTKEMVIINIIWANLFSLIVLFFAALLFGLPFYLIWHTEYVFLPSVSIPFINRIMNLLIYFIILFFGIVLHELIHGIFFMVFTKKGVKSIKFGIMPAKKFFTPYCHGKEPLKINHYRIVIIMPAIILGVMLPLFIGSLNMILFGIIFICAGAINDNKTNKRKK